MKKSRFSEQQIAFVLRQAEEGTAVAEVCRKAGLVRPSSCLSATPGEAPLHCRSVRAMPTGRIVPK